MREISEYLGWSSDTIIRTAIRYACEDYPQLRQKEYSRIKSRDYTLEEFLIICEYLPIVREKSSLTGFIFTPAMKAFVIDNFIHRKSPSKIAEPKHKMPVEINKFLYFYKCNKALWKSCVTCIYLAPRVPKGTLQKEKPYCTFYECFLHKAKPKRNIYFDKCLTFRRSYKSPYLFLENGAVREKDFQKYKTDMAGIEQANFISKRPEGEPMYTLMDIFSEVPDQTD